MKKLTILMILIVTVLSCTAENRALWDEVQREKKERGGGVIEIHTLEIYIAAIEDKEINLK
ncbi:MAG: hypothetical protein Q4D53_08625 [Leptotrichiaceae bacterium]|nr:hypothetical protein [Leptotrichiaceae bacterium]